MSYNLSIIGWIFFALSMASNFLPKPDLYLSLILFIMSLMCQIVDFAINEIVRRLGGDK